MHTETQPNPHDKPVSFLPEKNDKGKKIYRASPPVLKLVRGETITLRHSGEMGVSVFIPFPQIFEETGHVHNMHKTSEGPELKLHVRKDAPQVKGEFDYVVFSHDLKRFAIGNSPPRMILDDDDD